MAYQGFDLATSTGSLDSSTLAEHSILVAGYNLDEDRFEVWISDVAEDADELFTALKVFELEEGLPVELLASFEASDSSHSNIGDVTIGLTTYHNVEVYIWDGASNPLTDVLEFSIVFEGATPASSVPFEGVVWWPHLDMGNFGVQKNLIGFDVVSDAPEGLTVSVGYDQRNVAARTTPYEVDADTLPGQLIPLPVGGPSLDLKLTFNASQRWELQAANLYIQDNRPTS